MVELMIALKVIFVVICLALAVGCLAMCLLASRVQIWLQAGELLIGFVEERLALRTASPEQQLKQLLRTALSEPMITGLITSQLLSCFAGGLLERPIKHVLRQLR